MKEKIYNIFLSFVQKTFSKERIFNLVSDLLDIVYENSDPLDNSSEGGASDV